MKTIDKMKRFITMFIALVAMFMGTKVMAKEAYAVLSDDGKTLTFRYDSSKSSYGDKAYDLNEGNNLPGWNGITTVETVVFEESFATARPVSTYSWFEGLTSLGSIVNIENLNTSEVTTMSQMFQNCSNLTSVTLSGFDTKNVTNMSHLFFGCSSLKSVDLSGFDTQNVTTTARMFFGCSSLTSIKLNGINTSNVEFMSFMFSGCQGLTSLDLSSFNTTNVRYMNSMFNGCGNLKTITVGVNWTTDNVPVTSSLYMFSGCTSLVGGAGTTYNSDKVDKEYARIDGGESDPGYLSLPPEAYAVYNRSSDNVSTLTFYYDNLRNTIQRIGIKKYDLNEGFYTPGWISDERFIEKVVFDESFKDARPTSTYCWFSGNRNLDTFVGWENLNTSEVTNMNQMFMECSSLTSVDLSAFDTKKVQTMNSMFDGCTNLTTITVGANWNTANVTTSSYMFSGCTSIVGGAGTTYNINKVDKEYARIDGGTSNPGYLTALTYNLKLAGVRVTAANQNNVLGNGIFTYVPSSKTLKVKGSYSSSLNAPLIESHIDGLIIDVMQDAVLEASSTHGNQVFWLKDGTTTMKGKGKLTLKSLYETGIYLTNSASVVIDNMIMVIDAYWGIAGPPSGQKQEKLTIKSSNIVITTGSSTSNDLAAICDLRGGIVLQGCSITSPNGYNISNGSVYNNGNLAREVTITVDGGISTDIDAIDHGQLTIDKSLPLYNLNGQRVSHPVKGQIYIQNGRKVKF